MGEVWKARDPQLNRDVAIKISAQQDEEVLLKSSEVKFPYSWSSDGRFLLYVVQTPKAREDIWILPMEGSQKAPMLFQGTEFDEDEPQFSADGRWIAYISDESGRYEVYVREFALGVDGKPESTPKHQISSGGGHPVGWNDNGKELIYTSLDQRSVMSAEISTRPVFQASPARTLFQLPTPPATNPAVTGDGKRFLVPLPVGQSGPLQFTVVLNWQAGLKK